MDLTKTAIEKVIYPVMENLKGNNIRKNIVELRKTQKLSAQALKSLQGMKLARLLAHCIEKVPAYRAYGGLSPLLKEDPFRALQAIELLEKKHFTAHSEDYLSAGIDPSSLIRNQTGGSTGIPVRFYMDRHTVEYYEAARWRGLSWWGITPGSRSVMVWGNPFELKASQQRMGRIKDRWLKNRIAISAYNLNPKNIDSITDTISRFQPEYIYGYASALYALAGLTLEKKARISVGLKAVVSTAESLPADQRRIISEAFSCPVVNEYGAKDAGILAYECPHGGMHIAMENAYIEIVDPVTNAPAAPGEIGTVLVTDLNNFSMPRLRYRLGDMAAISADECGCGMHAPVLESIDGREDSMFVRADGAFVHGHAFNQIARTLSSVEQFQIIQKSPSEAVLNVQIAGGAEHAQEDLKTFLTMAQKLLPGTEIQLNRTDNIPPAASGKFRYAIREFPVR